MSNQPATVDRPRKQRAKTTNALFKLDGVHRQSELGRRYEDLARGYVAALGGEAAISETQRAAIRRAAELTSLAEQRRAQSLRGEAVDDLGLCRLEGVADRAVRSLKLPTVGGRPKRPSLREYAAAQGGGMPT